MIRASRMSKLNRSSQLISSYWPKSTLPRNWKKLLNTGTSAVRCFHRPEDERESCSVSQNSAIGLDLFRRLNTSERFTLPFRVLDRRNPNKPLLRHSTHLLLHRSHRPHDRCHIHLRSNPAPCSNRPDHCKLRPVDYRM